MKKILFSLFTILAINSFAQTPFTPGNLVVTRVGTGGQSLTNQSQVIKIIEMTPTGTVVQTIDLPYSAATETGGNNKICAQGSSSNDANLTISANGAYFVLGGYNSDTGIATISGVQGIKRVICRIAMDGTWDTKTLMDTAKSKGNARCVATNDGTGFWLVGSNTGARYLPYMSTGTGSDTATIVSTTVTNCRTIQPFGGDLIVTAAGTTSTPKVGKLTGFPTTSGNTIAGFPGIPTSFTANSIYMTSLPGGPSGLNTIYITSDAAPAGIKKYCLNAGTGNWDSIGVMDAAGFYRGLTGQTNGSAVTLYGVKSASPHLATFIDATGYNVAPTATLTAVSSQPSNTAYRGVQIVPTVLPIRLLAINAAKNDNGTAKIWWVVNGDDNVANYVVEKSINNKEFAAIGNVKPAGSNNYEFNDSKILDATTYYRVKFIDNNGSFKYSNVVIVTPKKSMKLEVFPNPTTDYVTVSYPKTTVVGNVRVTTLEGKTIINQNVATGSTQSTINVTSLVAGNYIIVLTDAEGNKSTKTIVKK
ncbi:MAG: T9SS type A sorting domain-containing protein [Chitinophagaceae bacterium]